MATKRISPTRQQYNIERERAARRIQRQTKVPIKYAREMLPPVPGRVTSKSIAELKNIRSKRGKYERNVISGLYTEYLSKISARQDAEKGKQFLFDTRKYRDKTYKQAEKERKAKPLSVKEEQPRPEYPTSEDTTNELYITMSQIEYTLNNFLTAQKPSGWVQFYFEANRRKAERFKEWLNDQIKQQGRETIAKKLNQAHDRALDGVWLILGSTQEQENEGYAIFTEIFTSTLEENIETSTAQMDTSYDE